MKKLRTAPKEIGFVCTASDDDLLAYAGRHCFRSPKAEKLMMERNKGGKLSGESVLFYIERHGLKESAAIDAFRGDNPKIVEALLSYAVRVGDDVILLAFMNEGKYERIKDYLKKERMEHVFPKGEYDALKCYCVLEKRTYPDNVSSKERMVQAYEDEKGLYNYVLKNRKFSPFFKLAIIYYGNDKLFSMMVDVGGKLNHRERDAVLYHGSKAMFDLVVKKHRKSLDMGLMRQIRMVRFGSDRELTAFIDRNRLKEPAFRLFMKLRSCALAVRYCKHYQPEGWVEMILNHPRPDGIVEFLSKVNFPPKTKGACEMLLLQQKKWEHIKAYIKTHQFEPENEAFFINSLLSSIAEAKTRAKAKAKGKAKAKARAKAKLDYYIRYHQFEPENEASFIKQCAKKMFGLVKIYVLSHTLSKEGQLAVLETKSKMLILLLLEQNILVDEALEVFEEMSSNEMWARYARKFDEGGPSYVPGSRHRNYGCYLAGFWPWELYNCHLRQ